MTSRIRITDVAPRDGLQNEPGVIPTADKARLIELLSRSGVDEIEVTSFVSPRWVPQLADAEQTLAAVAKQREGAENDRVVYSVLVPNEKGFERAMAMHNERLPLKIAFFTTASETFARKNTNATIAESIARISAMAPAALSAGMQIRMYISCVVACPYEGVIKPEAVRRVADQLLELAPADRISAGDVEIDLGDTIGVATPDEIAQLLDAFRDDAIRDLLVAHLHDTQGRAVACVRAALDRGVRRFDGSVAGLGGCPFAGSSDHPAPGNIATEALVGAIHQAGFTTSVDMDRLERASSHARKIIARAADHKVS